MSITRIKPGPRMSKAVVHGSVVYLAGQVTEAPDANTTVTAQTQNILAQIDALLAEAGTDKSRLITTNIWLSDMSTFAEMNAVWDTWVVPGATPARATVEAKLATPAYKVEIMVTAAL
ncbi:MAG TPA: RidA family protein [Xanthobacteraceae bacterium]|nr:RidA family protein [Xanthobacteraceae bacterium]